MLQPGGELVELQTGRSDRSRRYSPFNRAPGLRRVPDEPIGLGVLCSLVLHAILVMALVHVTDAPPEIPGADVSSVLMDLAASAPAASNMRIPAPRPASPGQPPATARAAAPRPITPAAAPAPPAPAASAPATTPRPASVPQAGIAPPKVAVGPGASAETSSSLPSLPAVPAPAPAEDGVAFMPATPKALTIPEPLASVALAPDVRPDPSWPEPPPPALASATSTQPARALVPVRMLQDLPPEASRPVSSAPGLAEPVSTAAEPPKIQEPTMESVISRAPPAEPDPKPAAPATPSATPHPAVAQAPVAPASSPFGLSLGRALVRLDGPRASVTDQPTPTITGRVVGGVPERLILYVNGTPADLSLATRTFEASVVLRPGANELRAVVTGPDGLEAEDTIMVQYVPPGPSSAIALTSPPDGLTLGPEDPPIVVVEGEIGERTAATVWIVANDRRTPVPASGGRFRHVLLLPDLLVRLWAEAPEGDTMRRSEAVTVRTAGARPRVGVLVMQWPTGTEGSSVEVSATWRAHPERLDGPVQTVRLPGVATTTDGSPSDLFFLRSLRPGVHTLIVRYRGGAPVGDVRPTLYLPDKDRLTSRPLRPVSLNGGGRRVVTKILMPQAILWEQEDWFSGRSESVDTVTKFRIPEGIGWVERKGNLP